MNQPVRDLPPSSDYLDVPGCDVIITTPNDKPITTARAAAILLRMAGKNPATRIDLYIKVRN